MKICRSAFYVQLLLTITTAVPAVKVEYDGTAVLPCSERCSGVASWTLFRKSSDPLAECDQTSCRSVKEGYQMIYNQYLKGDLSLIITEADFSKRGLYTCDCDGTDLNDVLLQIEPLKTSVQIQSGGSLELNLFISDPVEVIYNSRGSADGASDQICTVDGGSLQCKPEYTNRTSLSSSAALELRDMEESDSGVYTVRDSGTKDDIHIYTMTVRGEQSDQPAGDKEAVRFQIPKVVAVFTVALESVLVCVFLAVCVKSTHKTHSSWKD